MTQFKTYKLGKFAITRPWVMGILNVTPDSFFAGSRAQTEAEIACRARLMAGQGAAIIDVGACSTRPGGTPVGEDAECERLRMALAVVRRELPQAAISVDTFRPAVARMAVEEMGADIINDVGPEAIGSVEAVETRRLMFRTVAELGVPYILMSREATMRDMLMTFAREVQQLRDMGQKDIVLDPGFGFGKTLQQNYDILHQLERLQVLGLPVLAALSRKSMIYRRLGITPGESLCATTALHAVALMKGAAMLRVHDVKEAVECVAVVSDM